MRGQLARCGPESEDVCLHTRCESYLQSIRIPTQNLIYGVMLQARDRRQAASDNLCAAHGTVGAKLEGDRESRVPLPLLQCEGIRCSLGPHAVREMSHAELRGSISRRGGRTARGKSRTVPPTFLACVSKGESSGMRRAMSATWTWNHHSPRSYKQTLQI
jgi:hypothetical protein